MDDKQKKILLIVALPFVIIITALLLWVIVGEIQHAMYHYNYSDPADETKRMLSIAIDNPNAIQYTSDVAFQPGSALAAKAITERTGISKDQICMGAADFGDESDDDDFEVLKGGTSHKILYHGTSAKTVKIVIVCNVNFTDLEKDIETYGLEDKINLDNCPNTCKESGTCCAVILKRT